MKPIMIFLFFMSSAFSQSYTYYRLNVLDSSAFTCLDELQFFDGLGSQIPTTGGTASASSSTFGAAANAFDGNSGTAWCSGGAATPASPVWIQYHFTGAVTAASFRLISTSSAGNFHETPDAEQLQGSNDGSSWTSLGYYNAPAVWTAAGQTQSITINTARGTGLLYQLSVTAGNAGSNVAIAEMAFYDSLSNPIDISLATGAGYSTATDVYSGACTSGTCGPSQLIDGNTGFYYASNSAPSGGSPINLNYQFTSMSVPCVSTFTLTAGGSGSSATWYPTAFTLAYSTDNGATFTTVGTYTPSAASWVSTNPQTFSTTSCAPAAGAQAGAFIVGP